MITRCLFIALFFFLTGLRPLYAVELGRFGAVYPIAEKDALAEIEQRARDFDWNKVFNKEQNTAKLKAYRPSDLEVLPPALEDSVRTVDMTYTTEFDIPDGRGDILYPKGYVFNPLEYVYLPNMLVFIDGGKKNQVEWFKRSAYFNDPRTMLMLVGGSYYDLMRDIKRPVFYATKKIVQRLQLRAVPCVAVQKGVVMEIHEYDSRRLKEKM